MGIQGRRENWLGRSSVGYSIFFFQAEDGIRDWSVTGVQTCALPILDKKRSRCTKIASASVRFARAEKVAMATLPPNL